VVDLLPLCAQGLSEARNYVGTDIGCSESCESGRGARARSIPSRRRLDTKRIRYRLCLNFRSRWFHDCRSPHAAAPNYAPRSENVVGSAWEKTHWFIDAVVREGAEPALRNPRYRWVATTDLCCKGSIPKAYFSGLDVSARDLVWISDPRVRAPDPVDPCLATQSRNEHTLLMIPTPSLPRLGRGRTFLPRMES
jgi:hypothetical protein